MALLNLGVHGMAAAGGHALNEGAIALPLGPAVVCLHGRHANKEATLSIVNNLVEPLGADLLAINVESEKDLGGGVKNEAGHAPVTELREWLNVTGRLISLVPASDPTDEQFRKDTARGSWGVFGEAIAERVYLDLSGRLQCADMIRAHEQASGKTFKTLAHARMDFQMFGRLPDAITSTWRQLAESEPSVPHVFKPTGEDSQGVIDFMAISNIAGNSVENGVRDAITAGLVPFNTKFNIFASLKPTSGNSLGSLEKADGTPWIFPEQLTAGQFRAHDVHLVRMKWPMCRLGSDTGSCRYLGEVSRIMRDHAAVAQQEPQAVCGIAAPWRDTMLARGCCAARAGSQLLQGTSMVSSLCPPSELKGTSTCAADFDDVSCCRVASECAILLAKQQ